MESRYDERCSKITIRALLNNYVRYQKRLSKSWEKNRGKTLVYLDSAATSLTPKQVINSESEYYENLEEAFIEVCMN